MRPYGTTKRSKAIATSLAAAALLSGPVFAEKAIAANTEDSGDVAPINRIQSDDADSGHMLPPLSDHILLARLDQIALIQDEAESAIEEDDGTATQYNRGYYAEPVQIAQVVLVPATIEETEAGNVSDDATAQQFDRGYYKEPEMIVALIVVPNDGDE